MNLGIAIILIPLGFFISNNKQKAVFLSVLPLFIVGNIFQLSFLINHNHSIFNFFLIFANFYTAFFLIYFLRKYKNLIGKVVFTILLLLLTISGIIDMMVVKNDFQFYLKDAPSDNFMYWIKANTKKTDIFLARQEILDPITLSGRKNYLGHTYYLSVMGYNYSQRQDLVYFFFESDNLKTFDRMREEKIAYIAIPAKIMVDFNYRINLAYLNDNLKKVYEDKNVIVFKL